ncbi:hypothetical protein N7540_003468 [Penicillium herquei]|nr:hypothetical protein N7540_003468 [Penicillium herquei]
MASHDVDNEQEKQESTASADLLSTHAFNTLPQRRKRRLRSGLSWSSITLDTWILEEASMVFSIACLISIYGILIAYNGKQPPTFVYDISLNSIISILATGCKSSLVFVVGEGISQLKWLWFQTRQQLSYMQTFEDASRGPLGSVSLLFQHQGRSIASLGAMILIFMLAFDPMVQQIISYSSESIIIATDMLAADALQLRYFNEISDVDLYGACYLGIWATDFTITPNCPSGNCTWPSYKSVGFCSQCADITSTATLDCPEPTHSGSSSLRGGYIEGKCDVVLPHGHSSNTTVSLNMDATEIDIADSTSITVDSDTVWPVLAYDYTAQYITTNQTYSNIENPLLTLAHASLGFDSSRITNASNLWEGVIINNVTQCSFSYCLQDYNVSVTNGNATIEKSAPDFGSTSSHLEGLCWKPNQSPDDIVYTQGPDGYFENATDFSFCHQLQIPSDLFIGSINTTWSETSNSEWDASSGGDGIDNFGRIVEVGLGTIVPRVAESLTKVALQNSMTSKITGTVYTTEVIIRVRWAWMILPTLLVVLANVFLACTIYASRKKILWKSSILALLFHGLDDETAAKRDECQSSISSGMEKLADDMRVQLQPSESDGRVMLRER